MEKEPQVITSLPFPTLENRRRISRRDAIKQIAIGASAGSPLVIGAISHKDIQEVVSDPSKSDDIYLKYKRGAVQMLEGVGIDIVRPQKNIPEIDEIGKLLDVQLISTHDAFKIVPVNKVINYSWDIDSAILLKKCYDVLPSHFRNRDGVNRPLSIALGTEVIWEETGAVEIGQYYAGIVDNVMLLARHYFRPDMPAGSLSLLTHENIHFLQDSGRSKLETVMSEQHGWESIQDLCASINARIAEYRAENPNILNIAVDRLKYGVTDRKEDLSGGESVRDNLVELEAVLGELYLFGEEVFMKDMVPIIGRDLAHTFYRYTKNVTFRQTEYDSFPQL